LKGVKFEYVGEIGGANNFFLPLFLRVHLKFLKIVLIIFVDEEL